MPSYTAPLDDMLFLFEKLRDNKNYNDQAQTNDKQYLLLHDNITYHAISFDKIYVSKAPLFFIEGYPSRCTNL